MPDWATWASPVISAIAVGVSIVAIIVSCRAQAKANALQQRIVEIEQRREHDRLAEGTRADLRPELRPSGRSSYRLYLVNDGATEARNIRVAMDGKPLAEHPAAVANDEMPALAGPQSEIGCLLGLQ